MEEEPSSAMIPMADTEAVPEFDVVLRGYDRRQVDEYLDRIEADLATAQTERSTLATRSQALDKQLAEQDREVQAARRQLVETAKPTYAGLGTRVHQLLSLAEQEAAEVRAKAGADAAQTRDKAERDVAHLREHADAIIAEAKAKATKADQDHASALDARRQRAEREERERLTASQRRAEELTTAAEQQLAEAKKHAVTVRAEADKSAEALLSKARADAGRLVREAQEHRATLFATAKQDAEKNRAALLAEIAELQQRRDSVHAQLDQLRQVLGGLPGNGPATGPADGPTSGARADQDRTHVRQVSRPAEPGQGQSPPRPARSAEDTQGLPVIRDGNRG